MRDSADSGVSLYAACRAAFQMEEAAVIGRKVRVTGCDWSFIAPVVSLSGYTDGDHVHMCAVVSPVVVRMAHKRKVAGFAEVARVEREQGIALDILVIREAEMFEINFLEYCRNQGTWHCYATITPPNKFSAAQFLWELKVQEKYGLGTAVPLPDQSKLLPITIREEVDVVLL